MEKIKQLITNWVESDKGKDVLTVLIVILVGLGAFLLGRLSKESGSSGIKIEYEGQNSAEAANAISAINSLQKVSTTKNNSEKKFFASNRGTKYYSIGCSGGQTIKQENKVYFTTKDEAEKAGYTLSSLCK